jgi:hypothetical protein
MPRHKILPLVLSLFVLAVPLSVLAQTSPEAFLGFKVGADRKLADYNQIQAYFQKLASESPKIKVVEIGTTSLKKPMIMAVITSEANMARLDDYRGITRKLRDAAGLTPEEARRLSQEGKAILFITCNIHATEIASSQMSMELAYDLVTGRTPYDADKVLNDVIVLLAPTINPDGEQMVTEWYRKYVGTPYEGGNMPWVYHYYAGHDDNRDFFMMNLPETRAVNGVAYHDWIPQVHIDEHQMGSTAARLFLPPFMDPPMPNVLPLVWRSVSLCGAAMSYDLEKNGFKGVEHSRNFTGWWIAACDDTDWLHNCAGLLSEMASVRVATPIRIEPTEIPTDYADKSMSFVDPWPGGWWRLRDIVDYELTLSQSLVKAVAANKEDFLFNFYKMNKQSIETPMAGQPYAYVIPARQHDYPTTLKMIDVLMKGGLQVQQAKSGFMADDKSYPAGSFVVLLSQPYRTYAWALLGIQHYPDLRQYPGGPPIPPYDSAGWTLPLQMGVACDEIKAPFKADMERIETVPSPVYKDTDETVRAPWIALDARANASTPIVLALLRDKAEVYRSQAGFSAGGADLAAGSFLVKNDPAVTKALTQGLERWHLEAHPVPDVTAIAKEPLKSPRVALYQSWRGNMDEAWTRYLFDDMGIVYTTLHNADFKPAKGAKGAKVNLKDKCDVLIFADENYDIIKTGKPNPDSPYARYMGAGNWPPEYEGGIEKEGVDAVKAFVEQGGVLVTLNNACELVFKEFQPPVRSALERLERGKFFCPSSLLKIQVDNQSPIGYGMPAEAAAMFDRSLALDTSIPSYDWDRRVVASYPPKDVLMSGWLLGEEFIARKAAVVDAKYKKGRIILIGFRCQHRAESYGTYKFLLNALLYPGL